MVILFLLALAGCGRKDGDDFVVARVNGTNVMASEVRIHLPYAEEMMEWEYFFMYNDWVIDESREYQPGVTFGRAIRERAVREVAFQTVTSDFARSLGIALTDFDYAMIDGEIERLIEHFGRDEFNRLMQESGFRDENHMKDFFEAQILLDNLITLIITTPAEFTRFASFMPEEERVPTLLGAKHILAAFDQFDSEAEAEVFASEILVRALAGEDFDELMYTYTQDPGIMSFPEGYSFTLGDMMPEFEDGTLSLAIGEISGLVRTDFGIHIIKRTEPNAEDWYRLHQRQPRTEEDRMLEAIFTGLTVMVDEADIEFLAALDDI